MNTQLDYLHLTGTPYECCKKCDGCKQPFLTGLRITVVYATSERDAHFTACSPECEAKCRSGMWGHLQACIASGREWPSPLTEPSPASTP